MRVLIIHNTASGFGSDAIFQFERHLLREGDECVMRILKKDTPDLGKRLLKDVEKFDLVAISGGDFRKCMQTKFQPDGVDMLVARGQMLIAARAAGIQCFDTVFTNLDDEEGFEREVLQNKAMGFDGKSLINPKQIAAVHRIFAPTYKEVFQAEKIVRAFREQSAAGVGVFTVDGKMIDIAFIPGAERTLKLARACGLWEGDLV